jgi:hypothetical protein
MDFAVVNLKNRFISYYDENKTIQLCINYSQIKTEGKISGNAKRNN